jgi:hypothetical protein
MNDLEAQTNVPKEIVEKDLLAWMTVAGAYVSFFFSLRPWCIGADGGCKWHMQGSNFRVGIMYVGYELRLASSTSLRGAYIAITT